MFINNNENNESAKANLDDKCCKQTHQESKDKSPDENILVFTLPCEVELKMVKCPKGSFTMGSLESEMGYCRLETQHQVTLTEDFYMGIYTVTQAQYEAVMDYLPSYSRLVNWSIYNYHKKHGIKYIRQSRAFLNSAENGSDNLPVEMVSWFDAVEFCEKLNVILESQIPDGYKFDLPTEAQWEYACRAGTTTAFNNGKNLVDYCNDCRECWECSIIESISWNSHSRKNDVHAVGLKKPNAWGLYDMHGNVWEWCKDWFGRYEEGAVVDPQGCHFGERRVYRGGCWNSSPPECRSAYRSGYQDPDQRYFYVGFRLALVPRFQRDGTEKPG